MGTYLAHHGILGQKWGSRNGPPYPLDPKKDYSKKEQDLNQRNVKIRKDGGVTIKKGSTINRMTKYDESVKTGHAYVTFLQNDSERYKGFFGAKLAKIGSPLSPFRKIYQAEYKAKETMRSPGKKERFMSFDDLYKNDPEFRNQLEKYAQEHPGLRKDVKDYSKLSPSQMKQGYTLFAGSLGSQNGYIRDKYFEMLSNKGYNFVIDDMDANKFGRMPAIVFDTKKTLEYQGQRRTNIIEIGKTFKKEGRYIEDYLEKKK